MCVLYSGIQVSSPSPALSPDNSGYVILPPYSCTQWSNLTTPRCSFRSPIYSGWLIRRCIPCFFPPQCRYKVTSRRVSITTGVGGKEMTEVIYPDIAGMNYVFRYAALAPWREDRIGYPPCCRVLLYVSSLLLFAYFRPSELAIPPSLAL